MNTQFMVQVGRKLPRMLIKAMKNKEKICTCENILYLTIKKKLFF